MNKPNRAEVWLVDLGYVAKTRPCLILSVPALDADRALITILPHTTSTRGNQYEVPVQVHFLRPGAFNAQDIQTHPHAKFIKKLGELTADQMQSVEDAVCDWLGL